MLYRGIQKSKITGNKRPAARALSTVAASGLAYTGITRAFNKFRGRDNDSWAESIADTMAGIPYYVGHFYNMFFNGYEMDNMVESRLNNLFHSTMNIFDEETSTAEKIKDFAISLSDLGFAPLKNIERDFVIPTMKLMDRGSYLDYSLKFGNMSRSEFYQEARDAFTNGDELTKMSVIDKNDYITDIIDAAIEQGISYNTFIQQLTNEEKYEDDEVSLRKKDVSWIRNYYPSK